MIYEQKWMIRSMIFLSVVFISVALDLGRPPDCIGNPSNLMNFCCALPPFFTLEVARKCGSGVTKLDNPEVEAHNVTILRRFAFDCRHWYCVLDQYGLITAEGKVDHEKFYNHLDLWVTLNPSFSDVMIEAKLHCKQHLRFYFPLPVCHFRKLSACFRFYLQLYCPVPFPTPQCQALAKFFKNCGSYFL